MRTNSGRFADLAISPNINAATTIGKDGIVRLWDYANSREYYSQRFLTDG